MFWKRNFDKLFLLSFIYLMNFNLIQSDTVSEEITLNKQPLQTTLKYKNTNLLHITGEIDLEKKYLLITASRGQSSGVLSPYLFVTKEQSFNPEQNEYDYSSIQDDYLKNRIVIPSSYFITGVAPGFYLNATCLDDCSNYLLDFKFTDTIDIEVGDQFSFYSKDSSIFIDINVKGYRDPGASEQMIAFILSGGDESQLEMKVDSIMVYQKLPNVFAYNKKSRGESSKVNIKVQKGVQFHFYTQLIYTIDSELSEKIVYETEYNQYYMVKGGREECFHFEVLTYYENYEITIVGQKGFNIGLVNENGERKDIKSEVEIEELYSSYTLEADINLQKICINSFQEEYSLIQIQIKDIEQLNEEGQLTQIVKMPEPLISNVNYLFTINGKKNVYSNRNLRLHSYNYFFENNNDYFEIQGINIGIQILKGDIKVYKVLCKTYPYCSITQKEIEKSIETEDADSDFKTLYPINGYISTIISSSQDTFQASNHRNIIAVLCNEEDSQCIYQITYYGIQNSKKLLKGNMITKYLGAYKEFNNLKKEDKYDIFLHSKNKVVVDLVVYSGDAFIVPNVLPDQCTFEEHHLGSNEKRIFFCDDDLEITNYIKYSFKVQTKKEGAVYTIYVQEKEKTVLDDIMPVDMTIMESFHEKKRNFTIQDIYLKNPKEKQNLFYVTLFNTLNCELKIKNYETGKEYLTSDEEVIVDIFKVEENLDNKVDYVIQKTESTHGDEKNCLFYVSSSFLQNDRSYLIIPESKPFRIKLNKDIKSVKIIYPYASVLEFPKIYLGVSIFKEVPIKITIKVGFAKPKEYLLFHSRNIDIINYVLNGLTLNSLVPIKITVELYNKNNIEDETIIDLNLKTSSQIPYSIKSEEYFSDIVNYNNTQYYISLISQGTRGEVLLNFKRGTGVIYGRLFGYGQKKEITGWNNRIILPTEKTQSLLKYDFYNQKLIFTQNDTEICENYCYLVFGVKAQEEKKLFGEEYISPYSLYYRYYNLDEYNYNFIYLKNNDFISGAITNIQNDYYIFKIQHDSDELLIEFKSDLCMLTLAFNSKNFNDELKTKKYISKGANKLFRIKREDILTYYQDNSKEKLSSIKDLIVYIKLSRMINNTSIDIDILDMKYKLRINAPLQIAKNYVTAETDRPVYCEPITNNGEHYCDFLLGLDIFDYLSSIEMVGVSSRGDVLSIYANIIDENDFTESINNNSLVSWPSKKNYSLPTPEHEPQNFLLISLTDIPIKKENELITPVVLVRIYSSGNSSMELISSLINAQEFYTPLPKDYQLLSADTENGIKVVMPSDQIYNVHLITIFGKGSLTFQDGTSHTLYGDFDSLILNTRKDETTIIDIKGKKYQFDEDYDSNFRFFLWYIKNNNVQNMEKLSFGSGCSFIHQQRDPPFSYYVKIVDYNKDLPFNIIFNDLETFDGYEDPRDEDSTEIFEIKGYLLTEEKLLEVQTNKSINPGKEYTGIYDITLHQGSIIIYSSDIIDFYNENINSSSIYCYMRIEKPKKNKREYSYIKGSVSIFSPNDVTRSAPIDINLINSFKAHKNKDPTRHIYNLNGLTSVDQMYRKLKLEFSSLSNDLKVKIIRDPKTFIDSSDYFGVTKMANKEEFGIDIFIISEHIEEAHLLIECPQTDKDIEYMFKYSVETRSILPYTYNSTVEYTKYSNGIVNLTIDKIKYDPILEPADCNYYIRVYEENSLLKDNSSSISPSKIKPYSVFKVDRFDDILSVSNISFNIEIQIDLKKKYYIDVVAEIFEDENNNYLAYKRFYPIISDKRNRSFDNKVVYIIFGICGIFLILVIILIAVSFIYKNKNTNLKKRVEDISFKLSQSNNNNNLLIGNDDEDNVLN